MKVYTKTGDKGETSLFGGKRVSKGDLRIESYGTVDELNSWIGLIRDQEIDEVSVKTLLEVQDRLFTIGSHLATDPDKPMKGLPEFGKDDITYLEGEIDRMDKHLAPMRSFVLPGGHSTVSYCHIARTVCRRAERLVVTLDEEAPTDPLIIEYLNRLSDYLFVLSRYLTAQLKVTETPWNPRK